MNLSVERNEEMDKCKTGANRGAKPVSVRKPSNRGGVRKNIGKTPSLKAGRPVWWESLLERDYIVLLEFDPDVITFVEQPFRVRYSFEGRVRHYTPDFLVERKTSGRWSRSSRRRKPLRKLSAFSAYPPSLKS
jgi:hypothetical protein